MTSTRPEALTDRQLLIAVLGEVRALRQDLGTIVAEPSMATLDAQPPDVGLQHAQFVATARRNYETRGGRRNG